MCVAQDVSLQHSVMQLKLQLNFPFVTSGGSSTTVHASLAWCMAHGD
jgi:hypothetical protein